MNWYKFEEGNPIRIPQIKNYQVCLYEKDKCFDELFFEPNEIEQVMPFVVQSNTNVYANFKNGKSFLIFFIPKEES